MGWAACSEGSLPTPISSELERLLPARVTDAEGERAALARDAWPLATAHARRGVRAALPDAIVRPGSVEDVQRLLSWCSSAGVAVVPCGARSGVCGGIRVDPDALEGRSCVALDMRSLAGVTVEPADLRATAYAGTPGREYEEALERNGLAAGHVPQSLYISTVGGWLACRSAGQFSTRYGKAEDLVAGMDVVLASGERVSIRPQPATAAGPDLGRLFCGSEGTLGVIVRATLRAVPQSARRPCAFRFASFPEGMECLRELVQAGLRPPVARLYDEADTAWSFPDIGEGSLLIVVLEGPLAMAEEQLLVGAVRDIGGEPLGPGPAERWLAHRFDAVEQLEAVMRPDGPLGPNVIADTMEVAGPWSGLHGLYRAVREALEPHAVGVLCHASHLYADGACLYFTFAVQGPDEEGSQSGYHAAWEGGMEACLGAGGTITHHHGVGRLKAEWLRRELGDGGWSLLLSLKRALDPAGILNPGNLGLP